MLSKLLPGIPTLLAAVTFLAAGASADDFYKGKRVTLYAAASLGCGYAIYG